MIHLCGVCALNQGYRLSSTIFAATLVFVIDRRFLVAAGWMWAAALLSCVGLIHAYELTPFGVANKFGVLAAPAFAAAYAATALLLVGLHFTQDGACKPSR